MSRRQTTFNEKSALVLRKRVRQQLQCAKRRRDFDRLLRRHPRDVAAQLRAQCADANICRQKHTTIAPPTHSVQHAVVSPSVLHCEQGKENANKKYTDKRRRVQQYLVGNRQSRGEEKHERDHLCFERSMSLRRAPSPLDADGTRPLLDARPERRDRLNDQPLDSSSDDVSRIERYLLAYTRARREFRIKMLCLFFVAIFVVIFSVMVFPREVSMVARARATRSTRSPICFRHLGHARTHARTARAQIHFDTENIALSNFHISQFGRPGGGARPVGLFFAFVFGANLSPTTQTIRSTSRGFQSSRAR